MFVAIKKLEIGGKVYEVGAEVPAELVEPRFLRAKKVAKVEVAKAGKVEPELQILTEVSSEVETVVEETPEEIVETPSKKSKK